MAVQIVDSTDSYFKSLNIMREGLKDALDTLAKIKALKGRQLMEQNIREALQTPDVGKMAVQADKWLEPGVGGPTAPVSFSPGAVGPSVPALQRGDFMRLFEGTQEEKQARLLGAISNTRASARPKDFLAGLWSVFNPNVPTFLETTPLEELVTRGMAGKMFEDPWIAELRRLQMESMKALAQQRQAQVAKEKDLSIEIARLQGILETAEIGSELEAKIKARIDQLTKQWGVSLPEQPIQEPIDAVTMASPSMVPAPAGSSFWDRTGALANRIPSGVGLGGVTRPTAMPTPTSAVSQNQIVSAEPGVLPEGTGIGRQNIRPQPTAPRPEFDAIWPKLTDEQKAKVAKAMGYGYPPEEILASLRDEGVW